MTAIQQQYNQLLLDQAKLRETQRTNVANEQIRQQQADASTSQASSAARQASAAEAKNVVSGVDAGMKFLTGLLKLFF